MCDFSLYEFVTNTIKNTNIDLKTKHKFLFKQSFNNNNCYKWHVQGIINQSYQHIYIYII